MRTMLVAMLAGGLLLLAPIASGEAAVYVHVDAAGTAHFTDAPTKPYFRPIPAFGLPSDANLVRGQYADLVNRIARKRGGPGPGPAIIKAESNFDPLAVSQGRPGPDAAHARHHGPVRRLERLRP
jgi:hypothetical protein